MLLLLTITSNFLQVARSPESTFNLPLWLAVFINEGYGPSATLNQIKDE
jgi:hypothetical protein